MKLGVNTHFIILDFWLDTLEWQLEKRLIPYWKESTVGLDEATVRAYIRQICTTSGGLVSSSIS